MLFLLVLQAAEEILDEIHAAAVGESGVEIARGEFLFEGGVENLDGGFQLGRVYVAFSPSDGRPEPKRIQIRMA